MKNAVKKYIKEIEKFLKKAVRKIYKWEIK